MRSTSVTLLLLTALVVGCGGEASMTTGSTGTSAVGGDAKAGEALFSTQDCGLCHTLAAADAKGTAAANLDESKPSVAFARELIAKGRGAMPAYKDRLSAQEIEDLAAFVSQAAGGG